MRNVVALPRRYWPTVSAALVLAAVVARPDALLPLARAYLAFCERFLRGASVPTLLPPRVAALLILLMLLWVAIALVALARQIVGQRALDAIVTARRIGVDARLGAAARAAGVRRLVVAVDDERAYIFCGGLLRPRIYVSSGFVRLLTRDELEAALRHEACHAARRDPLRFFLISVVAVILAPFPLARALAEWVTLRAELAADRAAVDVLGVAPLAGALVKTLRAAPVKPPSAVTVALSPTDARIAALAGRPEPIALPRHAAVASLGLAAAVMSVFVTLATRPMPMTAACELCRWVGR